MHQEVEALLALQEDDLKIREIESQMRALDPQLAELDKRRDQVASALARAEELDRVIPLVDGAQKDELIAEKVAIRDELKGAGNFKMFRRTGAR